MISVKQKYRQILCRAIFYSLGVFMMAFGIVMCSCADLGISCMTSLPYSIAAAFNWKISTVVFCMYCIYVALQFLIRGKNRQWIDLLQLPFSVVFSAALELFEAVFPPTPETMTQRIILLLASIVVMAVGVGFSVPMRLAPNPCDGLVFTISEWLRKDMGLVKNIMDMSFVALTCLVDLIFIGQIRHVGLGTVICMIGIGRVVYLFNRFCRKKVEEMAGMRVPAAC